MTLIKAYSSVRNDVAADLADTVGRTWPDPFTGSATVAVDQVFFAIAPSGATSPLDNDRIVAGERRTYRKTGENAWIDLGDKAAQLSRDVLRRTGKSDLGLGQVTNTSDAQKVEEGPIALALAEKVDGSIFGQVTGAQQAALDALAIASFAVLNTKIIPLAYTRIRTNCHSSLSLGGAYYDAVDVGDEGFEPVETRWRKKSQNGRWFQLSCDQDIYVEMFGAVGDHPGRPEGDAIATDDTDAITAAWDFSVKRKRGGQLYYRPRTYLTGPQRSRTGVSHWADSAIPFNESTVNTNGAQLWLKPGSTAPLVYNDPVQDALDGATPRQPGENGLMQYYHNASFFNLTLNGNAPGNNDSRADVMRFERAWGVKLNGCYLKAGRRGFALRMLDCNILRIRDLTVLGPSFFWSVADSTFDMQAGGQGSRGANNEVLNLFWPTMWFAGRACWKNRFSAESIIYNNTGNIGAYRWNFTAADNTLTFDAPHFFNAKDPIALATTGTLPGGLDLATVYFALPVSNTQVKLCRSPHDVETNTVVTIGDAGTGVHTISGGYNAVGYFQGTGQTDVAGRWDQSYGSNLWFDGAKGCQVSPAQIQEAGQGNANASAEMVDMGIKFTNGASGNLIVATILPGGNQNIGIYEDATSYDNDWSSAKIGPHATADVIQSGRSDVFWVPASAFQPVLAAPPTYMPPTLPAAPTFSVPTISNPPTQAQVQSLANFLSTIATYEATARTERQALISALSSLYTSTASARMRPVGGGRGMAWPLSHGADIPFAAMINLPQGWRKARVVVVWANAGSGSGDVAFSANIGGYLDGETLNAGADSPSSIVGYASGALDVKRESKLPEPLTVRQRSDLRLRVYRRGTSALDTLANDVNFLGALLVRA